MAWNYRLGNGQSKYWIPKEFQILNSGIHVVSYGIYIISIYRADLHCHWPSVQLLGRCDLGAGWGCWQGCGWPPGVTMVGGGDGGGDDGGADSGSAAACWSARDLLTYCLASCDLTSCDVVECRRGLPADGGDWVEYIWNSVTNTIYFNSFNISKYR